MISSKIQELLKSLERYQLNQIYTEPSGKYLRLDFEMGPQGHYTAIELIDIVQLSISRTLQDEGCYNVFEITMNVLREEQLQVLSSLGYVFINDETQINFCNLLYFHLEGDIDIQIICQSYRVIQQTDRG
jgi:hypothetical protein